MGRGMKSRGMNFLFSLCMVVLLLSGVDFPVFSSSMSHAMEEEDPFCPDEAVSRVIKGGPAVVHIEVIHREITTFPSWFYKMAPFIQGLEKSPYEKANWQNRGTGVLIDNQGHILTNYHIAGGATKIQVLQADSRRFPARLRGEAPETDLAVIRLPVQQPITYMTFGDSDKVRKGDRVMSIGYGSEQNQIAERGIILSLSRSGRMDPHDPSDLIRFDIPVHPDNTGGPLCNLRGEIVGINSALMTRLSGVKGAGFAIPGNVAMRVAQKLIKNGTMNRGWLGVTVQAVALHPAGSDGPEKTQGALVTYVIRGGPADRAGMKTGDVITFFGDQEVRSAEHFRREVAESPAGEKVSLTIVRNKHEVILPVVIGNPEASIRDPAIFIRNRLGADVRPVTTREADQYDLDSRQGMVITELYPGSLLRDAGFELNDIIMEVEGRPVKDLKHFIEQIIGPGHKRRVIMLGLDHRTGRTGFIQVEIP